ncbi:MAG TPA: hypothetical protein PLL69_09635 [Gemmatimonadales bacterium]|nr:hypothetical protein [Gemmatimonadales bacterium]
MSVSPASAQMDRRVMLLVADAVVDKADYLIVRPALASDSIPLQINLPVEASDSQWTAFSRHLMAITRGRAVREDDQWKWEITLSSVQLRTDSLVASVQVGRRTRCDDRWMEDMSYYRLAWPRRGDRLSFGQRQEQAIVTDSFLCPAIQ